MEWLVYLLLFSATLYAFVIIVRVRKQMDEKRMHREIDQDFEEEFEFDEEGELTDEGMEEMLDWLDDRDAADRMEGVEQVKDFPDPRSSES